MVITTALYTLFAFFIARCEIFPMNLNRSFFQSATEMIHVNVRHYAGRSKSGPMLIRVSPLYANFGITMVWLQ